MVLTMFKKGEIYLAHLNPKRGNEMGKLLPVIIYQTNLLNDIEHPTTIVLPLSTHLIDDAYPLRFRIIRRDNLDRESDAVLDQIRTIDNRRILPERIAQLDGEEIEAIDRQVKIVLGVG